MTQTQHRYSPDAARASRDERRRHVPPGDALAHSRHRLSSELLWMLPVLGPVVLAGAAASTAAVWALATAGVDGSTIAGAVALLVASAIAEALPVPIEGVAVGRTSLATVSVVATAVLYGWAVATLVAALAMACVELARRQRLTRVAYNTAVYALAGIAAGGVADAFEGTELTRLAPATLLAASAFYLVDVSLVAAVISRYGARSARRRAGRLSLADARSLRRDGVPGADPRPGLGPVSLRGRRPRRPRRRGRPLRALDPRCAQAPPRARPAQGRVRRRRLARAADAARLGLRRRRDARARRASMRARGTRCSGSSTASRRGSRGWWIRSCGRAGSSRIGTATTLGAFDALTVAREVVDAARANLPPGLSIELVSGTVPPQVAGDAEKVKQVLVNLVENAVKYSPDGGRIEVAVAPAGDDVRFSVQDEGLGIPRKRSAPDLREVPPARPEPHARRGRHRPRPLHLQRARAAHGRTDLGHVRARPRVDVHLRAAARRHPCDLRVGRSQALVPPFWGAARSAPRPTLSLDTPPSRKRSPNADSQLRPTRVLHRNTSTRLRLLRRVEVGRRGALTTRSALAVSPTG